MLVFNTMKKAEVTAYLSLIFILLVTFVGAVIESASIQLAKNYARTDMNRAMESVFAEYQKELLENYDIFALEGSYESGNYSEDLIKDRLNFYGVENTEHAIERIQFLTDDGAKGFIEQVTYYMEHKYGLDFLKDKVGMTDVWKGHEEQAEKYEKEERKQEESLGELLEKNEESLPEEDNPISHINGLKHSPILKLVMPKEKQVSEKEITLGEALVYRDRNQGYGEFSDMAADTGTLSTLLFGEYLLEHFQSALQEGKGGMLDYELEYILAGKGSDRENLEAVVKKLLMLRFVPNYAYLQSSAEKKAEAETLAFTLCALLVAPGITEAAAQGILLAWAYGESIMDVRSLLAGHKVPLVKTDESFQLSLTALLKLGESGDMNDGRDDAKGLLYKEYLRMLLFLERKELIGMRTLDMIEMDLRKVHGLEFFRADQCISRMEIKSTSHFRRGISYQFSTYFGYL